MYIMRLDDEKVEENPEWTKGPFIYDIEGGGNLTLLTGGGGGPQNLTFAYAGRGSKIAKKNTDVINEWPLRQATVNSLLSSCQQDDRTKPVPIWLSGE